MTSKDSEPAATTPESEPPKLPQGGEPFAMDPANFSTVIDNPYLPMTPGTRMKYRSQSDEGVNEAVVIVTDQTKTMPNGVVARVVRDTVRKNGSIIEDTFDWYAQDKAGNVWYLGEDTAEFDHGKVTGTAGSFQAGADGALAGVVMPAQPAVGMAYRQEYYKGQAEDNAEILSTREFADVTFGHFDPVVLMKETTPVEPGVLEYKLYGRGIGPILALTIAGGADREQLVSVDTVPPGTGTGPLGKP